MNSLRKSTLAAAFAIILWSAPSAFGVVIFVNVNATGANNGLTWADAFSDLQDALALAENSAEVEEIWVAQGTYKPDFGTGDRNLSFNLVDGVGVYGGFAGTETSREQRDWVLNETILSGDLLGNDHLGGQSGSSCCEEHVGHGCDDSICMARVCTWIPQCCFSTNPNWSYVCALMARAFCGGVCGTQNEENSETVVRANGVGSETTLDGILISGGRAVGPDTFDQKGGGLSCFECSMTLSHCRVENNFCFSGGGGGNFFRFSQTTESPVIRDCTFRNNRANGGGALDIRIPGTTIIGCVFDSNIALFGGVSYSNEQMTIRNCEFYNNEAGSSGVIEASSGFNEISDCIFVGNRVAGGGGVIGYLAANIRRCLFLNNVADGGLDPYGTGGVLVNISSEQFVDCIFVGNRAKSVGVALNSTGLQFINCLLLDNEATGRQFPDAADSSVLTLGNHAFASFQNSIVLGNRNQDLGGAITVTADSALHVRSSIITGNTGLTGDDEAAQISVVPLATNVNLHIDNNIIQGWTGMLGGQGNFDADPLFVDPIGPDELPFTGDENLGLQAGSPAINAGNPTPPFNVPADLDGHPRVLCDVVDLGPFEFGIGDFDCDQSVNLVDFATWSFCATGPQSHGGTIPSGCEAFDFNADDIVDLSDFAGWQNTFAAN